MSAHTHPVIAWRHPKPSGYEGRCIGRTDLPVDPRRSKRLAHRVRQAARRHGWAREVHTSPLRRCADVGRWLRRWGWRHHIDAALLEMDFGQWDGQTWSTIARAEVDAWVADFADHAPGGGESLRAMLHRVATWASSAAAAPSKAPLIVIAHAGWMQAYHCLLTRKGPPATAADWPRAPAYQEAWCLAHGPAPVHQGSSNCHNTMRPCSDVEMEHAHASPCTIGSPHLVVGSVMPAELARGPRHRPR